MATLTEEQKKAYLECGGSKCPFCGSRRINCHDWDGAGRATWCKVDCDDCGEEWADTYRLVDVN